MSDSELVVVHTFGSRQEADVAVSALDAAGIEAIVQADTGGGMYRAMAWAGVGFQVLVRRDDADAARAILEEPARTMPE
jgi:Putative prokaryotic signal transducing protein